VIKGERQNCTLTGWNTQKMHGRFIFLLGLLCNLLKTMEPLVGFEPTTYSLRMNCSTPELQRRLGAGRKQRRGFFASWKILGTAEPGRTRTRANLFLPTPA
jgi:hypothetical protein